MCDSAEIDGHAFCLGLEALQTTLEEFSQQVTFLIRGAIFRPKQVSRKNGRLSLNICSLGELMDKYHTHEAKELRDKVYALLGMSLDGLDITDLTSNYNKGWEIVMQNLVKLLISKSVCVETWRESEMALVKGRGCILGQVSRVRRNTDLGRTQTVEAVFRNISEQPGCIQDGSVHWILEPSAKPVQEGDLICLMKGAISPMIIRFHVDHFDIIMIAPIPPEHIKRKREYIEWSDLARSVPFTRNFRLVWNWKICQGKSEGSGKYATSAGINNWYPGTEPEYELEKAIRTWNVALILGDVGEDKKAEEMIQEAIVGYVEAPRESNPHIPESQYAAGNGYDAIINTLNRKCDVDKDVKDYHHGRLLHSWAAANGHVAVVKALLDTGKADIESKGWSGQSSLSRAAGNGHKAVVKVLLDSKADIESKDQSGRSPLSWAAANGHEAVVKVLLDSKADIESKGWSDQSPLSRAAANGHEAVVKVLLDRKANIESKGGLNNESPLWWAAANGHEAVVKVLLDSKADIESKGGSCGQSPLSRAAANGHEAVVKLLLDSKADIESKGDTNGLSPLSWAAANGHEAVVKLLLDSKAYIESKGDSDRVSPLSWAAANGHEALVKLLLDRKADIESKGGSYGQSPLSWAATNGHEAVVKLLLDRKADIESKGRYGRSPLSWAAAAGQEAVVKVLLDIGKADIESKGSGNGQSPLSWAATNGHEVVVKLLLDRKADIESKDRYGRSPLSWAADNGHEAVVKLLLDTGKADIELKGGSYGQSPLSYAAEKGNEAIVKLLLDTGKADIESKDRYGRSPLSWAAEKGREAVVKVLNKALSPELRSRFQSQPPPHPPPH
jgi:ankyrin repeat protein